MKIKLLLSIFLLVSLVSFGKNYIISKDDFTSQFRDTITSKRVYCFNKAGEKVFVGIRENSMLTVASNNNKKKELILSTARYKKGVIEATEITPIWYKKV